MNPQNMQPSLKSLMNRLLNTPVMHELHDETHGEVEPHEILTGFRVDARTAWNDAQLPLKLSQLETASNSLPPEWGLFVNSPLGLFAVPLAQGEFPQKVRDLHPLMEEKDLTIFRPRGGKSQLGLAQFRRWLGQAKGVDAILARGLARSLGESGTVPTQDENELAADAWYEGRHEESLAIWQSLPDSPVSQFNRGMALLFSNHPEHAIPQLERAMQALPGTSGWSHLAGLYLALARTRISQ
jgi:hypothetical protein